MAASEDEVTPDESVWSEDTRPQEVRAILDNLTVNLRAAIDSRAGEEEVDTRAEAEALLRDAWRESASDLHLDPEYDGVRVRLRIDGALVDGALLPHAIGTRLINQFKTLARINPVTMTLPMEGRVTTKLDERPLDLRVAVAPCISGDKMAMRVLKYRRLERNIHELGLRDPDLDHIQEWLGSVTGMFLVVGPTGSGKTTTLYALLHRLKLTDRNIVTIEDPVEYEIGGVNQIQVDLRHGLDFAEAIKSMLRLDPDYLLLGEVRDPGSARAAVNAASSGRAVMSTIHCRDAVSAVSVLRNFGLDSYEISSTLTVVVAQRLVRKLCTECRRRGPLTADDKRWLQSAKVELPKSAWRPKGCRACSMTGYRGRTGVFEVWRPDLADYDLILKYTDERTMREQLAKRGHRFLLDDALYKAAQGITSLEELRTMGGFGPPLQLGSPD